MGEDDGAGDDGHHLVLPVLGFAQQGEDTGEAEGRVGRREKGEYLLPSSSHLNPTVFDVGDGGTLQGQGEGGKEGCLIHVKHPSPGCDLMLFLLKWWYVVILKNMSSFMMLMLDYNQYEPTSGRTQQARWRRPSFAER